ncbi:hypothetical protein J8273_6334 [Carpediemonas membranifera]|uniref:Uncharacterized protein n=1 Tax=Carpediemonas membranifera TaxID=201153 RepID=A0A8J6DY55_9EUKA|nr:hypothetical protein J8273_6334 [Carpediemonas membranifera]|eukprot:KAG9391569.1 hypothetical protein J8273_6334 [Carpediemonas membranifera]
MIPAVSILVILVLLMLFNGSRAVDVTEFEADSKTSTFFQGHFEHIISNTECLAISMTSSILTNLQADVIVNGSFSHGVDAYLVSRDHYSRFTHDLATVSYLASISTLSFVNRRSLSFEFVIEPYTFEPQYLVIHAPVTTDATITVSIQSNSVVTLTIFIATGLLLILFIACGCFSIHLLSLIASIAVAPVGKGPKSKWIAMLTLFMPGPFHYRYLNNKRAAIASTLTCGFCGIGTLIQLPQVMLQTELINEAEYKPTARARSLADPVPHPFDVPPRQPSPDSEAHSPSGSGSEGSMDSDNPTPVGPLETYGAIALGSHGLPEMNAWDAEPSLPGTNGHWMPVWCAGPDDGSGSDSG